MTIPTLQDLVEMKFDINKEAKALYLKGWEEHPSPDGKRMAYGLALKLGPVQHRVRILQEDEAGTAWRVDYHDGAVWVAMFQGRAFKSAAAAGQAVAGWRKAVEAEAARKVKEGYGAREAAYEALRRVRQEGMEAPGMRALVEKLEDRGNRTFVFTGAGVRLTVTFGGAEYTLEELPAKGKRQLRVAELSTGYRGGGMERAWDALLAQNVLQAAKLAEGDDYAAVKDKVGKAVEAARGLVLARWAGPHKPDWLLQQGGWREKAVPAGRIAPEGGDTELVADGKDFALKVTWKRFRAYAPGSDFQQSDPSYSGIGEKSAAAAAKLFKLLQANPNALKGVAYKDLGAWLDDHKIARQSVFSTWS